MKCFDKVEIRTHCNGDKFVRWGGFTKYMEIHTDIVIDEESELLVSVEVSKSLAFRGFIVLNHSIEDNKVVATIAKVVRSAEGILKNEAIVEAKVVKLKDLPPTTSSKGKGSSKK